MALDVKRETYTIAEAAQVLGISRNSAYEACRNGTLPVLKIGRRLVCPVAAINHLLCVATGFEAVRIVRAELAARSRI